MAWTSQLERPTPLHSQDVASVTWSVARTCQSVLGRAKDILRVVAYALSIVLPGDGPYSLSLCEEIVRAIRVEVIADCAIED